MIMSAVDLIQRNPDPSEEQIREGLIGNICRCTGYHNIVRAVKAAAEAMHEGARSAPTGNGAKRRETVGASGGE
jgi:aerobic carbon-monoxide dehydrogenase small subunit